MRHMTLLTLAALAAACSNVDRLGARNEAVQHACSFFDRCGDIGSGKTYTSGDDCNVQMTNYFNSAWPDTNTACASIHNANLDVCLQGIDATQCGNGADFLNTAFVKCSSKTVCGS